MREPPSYLPIGVIQYDMGNKKRVTFRADEDKIDYLDRCIKIAQIEGRLDNSVSRSDLLRECVDELIEELEGEGEVGNSVKAAA